jgi:Sulfate permease and related transporters (MFS superfamily)
MACFVYTIFGSCKDSAIGPTAIMSILTRENLHGLGPQFAVFLTFVSGIVQLFMGLLQLGEFTLHGQTGIQNGRPETNLHGCLKLCPHIVSGLRSTGWIYAVEVVCTVSVDFSIDGRRLCVVVWTQPSESIFFFSICSSLSTNHPLISDFILSFLSEFILHLFLGMT